MKIHHTPTTLLISVILVLASYIFSSVNFDQDIIKVIYMKSNHVYIVLS